MDSKIQVQIDRLATAKASFIDLMESVNREEQSRSPESGWNMLQVMEHLIISDQGTFEYLRKKTQSVPEEISPGDEQSKANGEGLQRALLSEKRWKMPDVLPAPTGAQSYDNLLKFWDQLYTAYFEFLAKLNPEFYHRQVFRHPIAGRMDLFHTLEFQISHLKHHEYQLKRIMESLGLSTPH